MGMCGIISIDHWKIVGFESMEMSGDAPRFSESMFLLHFLNGKSLAKGESKGIV